MSSVAAEFQAAATDKYVAASMPPVIAVLDPTYSPWKLECDFPELPKYSAVAVYILSSYAANGEDGWAALGSYIANGEDYLGCMLHVWPRVLSMGDGQCPRILLTANAAQYGTPGYAGSSGCNFRHSFSLTSSCAAARQVEQRPPATGAGHCSSAVSLLDCALRYQ